MELTAGSWMGLLLGMVLVVSCTHLPPETSGNSEAINPIGDDHAEGGGLHHPGLDRLIWKRDSKGRKGAPDLEALSSTESNVGDPAVSKLKTNLHSNNSTSNREVRKHLSTSEMEDNQPSNDAKSGHNSSSTASIDISTSKGNTTTPSVTSSSTPVPKKKGKPDLTYEKDDLPKDSNGKPMLTKENLVSSGPAFDYVVPIVIAMLAVPLLAVIGTFLYKKSRDFWDRRHYRRMDFLIDGMYNDS